MENLIWPQIHLSWKQMFIFMLLLCGVLTHRTVFFGFITDKTDPVYTTSYKKMQSVQIQHDTIIISWFMKFAICVCMEVHGDTSIS